MPVSVLLHMAGQNRQLRHGRPTGAKVSAECYSLFTSSFALFRK
jgi:hypothetical protein